MAVVGVLLCGASAIAKPKPKPPCQIKVAVWRWDALGNFDEGLIPSDEKWAAEKIKGVCFDQSVLKDVSPAGLPPNEYIFSFYAQRGGRSSGVESVPDTETGTVTDSEGNTSQATVEGSTVESYERQHKIFDLRISNGTMKDNHPVVVRTFRVVQIRQSGGNGWSALGTNLRDRHPYRELLKQAVAFLTSQKH